jgi:hypothetical protein
VRPLPRSCGGSQSPSLRTRRKSRGQCREPASTGNRSREFGKQTSDERIGRCLSGGALQGATSREVPSLKEAGTWWEDIPDDQGRWREGENGAHVSRGCQSRFSRGDGTRGLRSSRGSRSRTRSNHGVRRLGFYAPQPLNRLGDTEVLDPRVNPRAYREVRALAADRPAGAESAVPEGDSRDVRGRIGLWRRLQQPAKTGEGGSHPRKGREAFHAATGG